MKRKIVIVGAGFAGASTAYHLAEEGETDVVLLEKEAVPGVHSSGRNAAMIRAEIDDPAIERMALAGRDVLATGDLAQYDRCGAMLLGRGDEEVSDHFPLARGRGRWCPDDGVVDVNGLLLRYLKGRDVRYNTTVHRWQSTGSGITVETNDPVIEAEVVVNATGAWAGAMGNLPLAPMRRHLFVTAPMATIDPAWPFVWDDRAGLYFRPESGGLLLSACDERATEPGDYREEPAVLDELARKVSELQPNLAEIAIARHWSGHRTFAADHRFVIGFDPRVEGLFHVAALGGHGVTTSPAVGRLAAALILGRAAGSDNPFDPGRLAIPGRIQA